MSVLEVNNLKKYYFNKNIFGNTFSKLNQAKKTPPKPAITKAVDDISFSIKKGEIVGLLGPNGAGKTTTSHMLLGVLTPTSGSIKYFGQEFNEKSKELLKEINFSSAYIYLPWRMTVYENLNVYAHIYEVKNKKQRIKKLLKEFEVYEHLNKRMNELSAGQKTRVLLAKAFINYPKLIILDEPTASLDPDIAVKVRQFLLKQQKEYQVAMLFTSHNMHEVQEICDRIIFLNKGKIIARDTPNGLLTKFKKNKIKMNVLKNKEALETYLKINNIKHYWQKNKIVLTIDEKVIPKTLYQLSENGVRYTELEILKPNLEDYFLRMSRNK
ncbi:hypothetical protein COT75_01560 [Candidatus Beckwithbacteria bacterium CG10_big_fil_rev_8_21_14_0_10_34_10]|uniref:ABC transporter domain-containing protein n=1 Tax=Candidatus Beckwithbacteria bacterium CG10_big_fil_rev_8_21_14_0_10_34_10 TaxID=1974495 RepID=A0A2H0WC12_9BACT|nr:MAG: hypothetical protein COT75_01560 [Candidatus Beckwithbacteria bacterium CG10_big_fil_rev_8_21_14_0_10_34_10]